MGTAALRPGEPSRRGIELHRGAAVIPRRVVLTGRGVVSPLGVGIEQHWEALRTGRCAIRAVAHLEALGLPSSCGAEVPADLLEPYLARLPRKQQKLCNRPTLLAMVGASLAVEDARLPAGAHDPARLGVLLGVNVLHFGLAAMTEYLIRAESPESPGSLDMPLANAYCMRSINPLDYSLKTLPNLAAGHVAIAHGAQGLSRALTEGPLGGAHAIGQAYRAIAEGSLDAALCGGTDGLLEEITFASASGLGLVAPAGAEHAGEIPGEGSGILLLEAAPAAAGRRARAHGEIRGFAAAAGDGELAPRADARRLAGRLARVIRSVIDEAEGEPDVVSLHADGVAVHEEAERLALEQTLGRRAAALPRLCMKRAHGSLGAASSPVEILACSAVLRHGIIPAIIPRGLEVSCPAPRRALVIALGTFGECAALMLEASDAD